MTLVINIFVPHFTKVGAAFFTCFLRCWDRSCRCNSKKEENERDDSVQTKKYLQSELQALYTGPQIASAYVYAQVFTQLWACITFSSGMPVLYVIAFVFFALYYFFYYHLLLRYYGTTS